MKSESPLIPVFQRPWKPEGRFPDAADRESFLAAATPQGHGRRGRPAKLHEGGPSDPRLDRPVNRRGNRPATYRADRHAHRTALRRRPFQDAVRGALSACRRCQPECRLRAARAADRPHPATLRTRSRRTVAGRSRRRGGRQLDAGLRAGRGQELAAASRRRLETPAHRPHRGRTPQLRSHDARGDQPQTDRRPVRRPPHPLPRGAREPPAAKGSGRTTSWRSAIS